MFDFNSEQEQSTKAYGPIPVGSMVKVRASVRQPRFPAPGLDGVCKGQSGMFYLDMEFEVTDGQFMGHKIWENVMLPAGVQKLNPMTEGQVKSCNIAGAKLKAILNAAHKILPKDDTPQAARKRQIRTWYDFNGLEFPIRVDIAKKPNQKDGKTFWNNTIASVITPDVKEYHDLMRGECFITDGPTTGDARVAQQAGGYTDGPDYPPASAYNDDVPF